MKLRNSEGEVAVLYAPSYGIGWYTNNTKYPECITDAEIAHIVCEYEDQPNEYGKLPDVAVVKIREVAESKWPGFSSAAAGDLAVVWLEEGTIIEITDFDGSESVNVIYQDYIAV